jgi:hypothetical protein
MNAPLRYFASDAPVDLQDALPSNHGVYTILAFLPEDFNANPEIRRTLEGLLRLAEEVFVAVEPLVIYGENSGNCEVEWRWFPEVLRRRWEWQVCGSGVSGSSYELGNIVSGPSAYEELGVVKENGIVSVVRPDGVVGGLWAWDEAVDGVEGYLEGVVGSLEIPVRA